MPATQNEVTAELWTTFFRYRQDKLAAITVEDVESLLELRRIGGQMAVPQEEPVQLNNHPFTPSIEGTHCIICGMYESHPNHTPL